MFHRYWRSMVYPGSFAAFAEQSELGLAGLTATPLTTAGGDKVNLYQASGGNGPLHFLFFYGNGMTSAVCEVERELLAPFGDFWVPDYVGYGESTGVPSEAGCYDSADAAYDYLRKQRHIPASRIVVVGRSLGAAVAIDLAARVPVAGLVAICPFQSLGAVATRLWRGIPVGALLGRRFDNMSKLPRVNCPILVVHGELDGLVPCEQGRRLAAQNPKAEFLMIPEAGHNNLLLGEGPLVPRHLNLFVRRVLDGAGE
ncbi:alpha/beta hydrolase [Bremerella sp.]|uniref:alpha/beta hydrolase n=1 Tax=Bremerella sp. TaxID=2795602 RepID=UPI00391DD857